MNGSSSSSQFAGIGYRGQSQIVDEVMRSGNIPVAGPGKNGEDFFYSKRKIKSRIMFCG